MRGGNRHPATCRVALFMAGVAAVSACSSTPADLPEPSELQLRDVAADVGIEFVHGAFRWEESLDPVAMMGGGLCWLDFNNDGWMDLYAVNGYALNEHGRWIEDGGLPKNALFENRDGFFTDVSASSGTDVSVRGNGCAAGDLDNDGDTDLYVTTERFNVLLWNNGDGTFTESAEAAGVDGYGWHTGAAIGDVNGDGWNDLFVSGYVDMNNRIPDATLGFPNTHEGRSDIMYVSNGNSGSGVTFTETAVDPGIEPDSPEYGLGAVLSDIDNDGDLDLYVANDTNPNRLYRNDQSDGLHDFMFTEIGVEAGVADINSGMGVAVADYDDNKRFDTFVTNFGEQLHGAYLNMSDTEIRYVDDRATFGVDDLGVGVTGWGTSFLDLDHDTDLDLAIANGDVPIDDLDEDAQLLQYLRRDDGAYTDASRTIGITDVGRLNARSVAAADFDNDGDLDIAVSVIGGRLILLENAGPKAGSVTVTAVPPTPGTKALVRFPDGRLLIGELHAGSSYLSTEDPRLHFGIGNAEWVNIVVRWPDGSEVALLEITPGAFVEAVHP